MLNMRRDNRLRRQFLLHYRSGHLDGCTSTPAVWCCMLGASPQLRSKPIVAERVNLSLLFYLLKECSLLRDASTRRFKLSFGKLLQYNYETIFSLSTGSAKAMCFALSVARILQRRTDDRHFPPLNFQFSRSLFFLCCWHHFICRQLQSCSCSNYHTNNHRTASF